MKKIITCLAVTFVLTISMSICFADDDHGENHICFKRVDQDRDGKVTPEEFSKFFPNDDTTFIKIDLDKDGSISHDEYEKYWYNEG